MLAEAYRDIESLVLTIDGLQPEKGHETLYVVRELRARRVWFAEALLSSSTAEIQRLIAKAKQWAEQLGRPVVLWMSDKQDAFVQGIAAECPKVPHRYCQNHFLRYVAAKVLKADSHAKVEMRKKVRGLRAIERDVLEELCRSGRHTSGCHTSGRHTSGRHTSDRHTSDCHTSGRHTSGRHTSGRHTSGRDANGRNANGR